MEVPASARGQARPLRAARGPVGARRRARRVGSAALSVLLGAVAAGMVLAAVSTRLSPGEPAVLGHPTLSVLSGSMGPSLRTGDLAVDNRLSADQARHLRAGQVITFRSAAEGSRLFTHRIVGVRHGSDGSVAYVTKGDANDSPDATEVTAERVIGLYSFRVPYGGYVLYRLHDPASLAVALALGGLVLLGIGLTRSGGGTRGRPERLRRGRCRGVRRSTNARLARVVRNAQLPRPRRTRRRLALGGVALTAAGTAALGSTLGLFTSTPAPASNSFTAGTVSLTGDATGACNVSGLMPGDAPPPCTYVATYTGTASAYLGLDVLVQTQPGSGGGPLYDPPAANNALTVAVTDNQGTPVTYAVPTTPTTCPVTAPAGSTCYALTNQLVGVTPVSASTAVTFTTAVTLPLAAGNTTQGAAAQVILTAHAVQSKNQTLPVGCTAGAVCSPTGSFSWS